MKHSRQQLRMTNGRIQDSGGDTRSGITMIELIVSAVLLMTVMSFATTLCFRINQVWSDIGQHRVALNELSNQLETITRLDVAAAKLAVAEIQPTEVCRRTLIDPEIRGEVTTDNLGTRIQLQINWNRTHPGTPMKLVGWLIPSSESE
jgi:hypothetical protein